jgi:hypothetical protein
MEPSTDICGHCGAPRTPGFAACKYCKTVFQRNAQTTVQDNAVPCPKCATLNEWGAQRCVQCQSWVVVQCVFCHALSPNHVPACLSCSETFAGAPERVAQQQAEQQGHQRMQVATAVGGVAASFLGALAGSALSGGSSYSYGGYAERHHHYDGDAGGDGGGLLDDLLGGDSDSSSDD